MKVESIEVIQRSVFYFLHYGEFQYPTGITNDVGEFEKNPWEERNSV